GANPDLYRLVAVTLARRLRDTTLGGTPRHKEPVILVVDARDATDRHDDLFEVLIDALRTATGKSIGVIHLCPKTARTTLASESTSICITDPEDIGSYIDSLLDEHGHVLLVSEAVPADVRLWRSALGRADLTLIILTVTGTSLARARQVLEQLAGVALPEP